MEDSTSYGSPGNGASPGSNPILAQPPLQPQADGAGDGEGMDGAYRMLHSTTIIH
jgi:SWI/SNF related-matrix-associated actin-dependent regulator of chromatin subfamily C